MLHSGSSDKAMHIVWTERLSPSPKVLLHPHLPHIWGVVWWKSTRPESPCSEHAPEVPSRCGCSHAHARRHTHTGWAAASQLILTRGAWGASQSNKRRKLLAKCCALPCLEGTSCSNQRITQGKTSLCPNSALFHRDVCLHVLSQ